MLPRLVSRSIKSMVFVYLGCGSCFFGILIPLCVMAWHLPAGLKLIARQSVEWSGLGREMLIAATMSLGAGSAAWSLGNTWTRRTRPGVIFSFNSLYIAVARSGRFIAAQSFDSRCFFNNSGYDRFMTRPIPWALTLIVWLFPRAVLLRIWVGTISVANPFISLRMLVDSPVLTSDTRAAAAESQVSSE